MSKLFILESDEVYVDLFVSETKNGRAIAWTDDANRPKNIEQCEKYRIAFREPNYSDTVALIDLATSTTPDGEFAMNLSTVRMQRVAMLIKSWDFVDESGKPVEPTIESIEKLNPVVALALVDGLEQALKLFEPEYEEEVLEQVRELFENSSGQEESSGE